MQETTLAFSEEEKLLYYIKDAVDTFGKSKNYSTKIIIVLENDIKVTSLQSLKIERASYINLN